MKNGAPGPISPPYGPSRGENFRNRQGAPRAHRGDLGGARVGFRGPMGPLRAPEPPNRRAVNSPEGQRVAPLNVLG